MRRLLPHHRFPVLCLALSISMMVPGLLGAKTLAVPTLSQLTPTRYDNWCWATVSQAVLSYTGNAPADKCTLADWARQQNGWGNDNCCTNGTGPICNQPNWLYGHGGSIKEILAHWGADSQTYGLALTERQLDDAIDDDSPVIVFWTWTGGGGHFVVARGYTGSMLDLMDPWNGPTQRTYASTVSASDRTWAASLVVVPKKVTYVVDDTGSMGDEIDSVRNTLLGQVAGFRTDGRFVKYTLITYKDSPTFVGSTVRSDEISGWIGALSANGGGDCPEDGYGALDMAAERAPKSDVWWMTDADSHGGLLRLLLTRFRLLVAGNTLHASILGSCAARQASTQADSAPFSAWRAAGGVTPEGDVDAFTAGQSLATATGGLFFSVSSGEIDAATRMILEEISSTALVGRRSLPAGSASTTVPVDSSVGALKVLLDVGAGSTGSIMVTAPGGAVLTPGSPGVTEIAAGESRMLIVAPPALVTGAYTLATSSPGQHVLSVSAVSPHSIVLTGGATAAAGHPFAVKLAVPSLAPPTALAGPGPDGPGGPMTQIAPPPADLPFDPAHLSFFAEKADGTGRASLTLFDDGLHGDGAPGDGVFGGTATFGQPGLYRLGMTDGGNFTRVTELVVSAGAVDVVAPAARTARPGDSVTLSFVVKNFSTADRTFDLAVNSGGGWVDLGSVPASVHVGASASATVPVVLHVPAGAASGQASTVSLVAVAQDDPETTDSDASVATAWQGPLLGSLSPNPVGPSETLVLAGSGFGADPGIGHRSTDAYHVLLAGVRVLDADVLSWSDGAVMVRVPAGTRGGLVHVVSGGQASNDLELVLAAASALTPAMALAAPGSHHAVVLTLLSPTTGLPVPGVSVTFTVLSGPNAGATGTASTDAGGHAAFSYAGTGSKGADEIRASYTDPAASAPAEATAVVFWDADCNANGIADTCDIGCAGFGGRCSAVPACSGTPDLNGDGIPDVCRLSGTEIPTVSGMGLLALALGLGLAGLLALRGRFRESKR